MCVGVAELVSQSVYHLFILVIWMGKNTLFVIIVCVEIYTGVFILNQLVEEGLVVFVDIEALLLQG